jgi:hypothetical protein
MQTLSILTGILVFSIACAYMANMAFDSDSIRRMPVCAFIQPVRTAKDRAAQSHLETILFLCRISQFTVNTLACRGPPGNRMEDVFSHARTVGAAVALLVA